MHNLTNGSGTVLEINLVGKARNTNGGMAFHRYLWVDFDSWCYSSTRCIFRNQPQKRGNNINVIMPASFPPPLEPISLEPSSGISNLHKDDLAKVCTHVS